jgi:hypothetical protein
MADRLTTLCISLSIYSQKSTLLQLAEQLHKPTTHSNRNSTILPKKNRRIQKTQQTMTTTNLVLRQIQNYETSQTYRQPQRMPCHQPSRWVVLHRISGIYDLVMHQRQLFASFASSSRPLILVPKSPVFMPKRLAGRSVHLSQKQRTNLNEFSPMSADLSPNPSRRS